MKYSYNWRLPQMQEELPAAAHPDFLFFHNPRTKADYPQENYLAEWVVCDSVSLKSFKCCRIFFR